MFKVGDKVTLRAPKTDVERGHFRGGWGKSALYGFVDTVATVSDVSKQEEFGYIYFREGEKGWTKYVWDVSFCEKVGSINKPHVHAELIKAWADGAAIEVKNSVGLWRPSETPSWFTTSEYRIKPEPKPDVVMCRRIESVKCQNGSQYLTWYCDGEMNTKVTFDGETGKLKSVEVIK